MLLAVATFQFVVGAPAQALVVPPAFELVDLPTGQAPNSLTDYACEIIKIATPASASFRISV